MVSFKDKLKKVKAFVFDVDGVWTNGYIYVDALGQQMRSTNVKDGYAVHYAAKLGYPIAIITGGKCKSIIKRFNDLGVTDVYLEASDKTVCFAEFLKKYDLKAKDILYMGDDIPDYPVMKKCGLKVCPSDAAHEILELADYISGFKGGEGCVRDIVEQTLRAQDNWFKQEGFVW
ncbi:MAG: HAD hydrolase family protein [Bacteroidales bacterium]|nr:HAD hydrolase family protein [Bacteroidales bacterium]